MLNKFLRSLVDIIYPRVCLACKDKLDNAPAENIICDKCFEKIQRNLPPFCHSCGRHLEKNGFLKNICPACRRKILHFDRAFSPYLYSGVIKELIHEFKYKNKEFLGAALAGFMLEFAREYNLPMDDFHCVVPIPLHKTKLREREFNQAKILAGCVAKEFKKDLLADTLIRSLNTKTQTDLQIDERFENVKGSFSVVDKRDISGKNILLIDDVLTTGATSSEAALALKEAGANIVFVLTLAS